MKKNVLIYLLGTITVAILTFSVIPFFTKYLTPSEYGLVAMYQVLLGFSKPFVGFVLESNVYRIMIKYSHYLVSKVIGTTLAIIFLNTFIFYIFIVIFSDLIYYFIPINKALYYLIPISAMSYSIISIFEHILISKAKAKVFVTMQIFTKLLNYGLSLYFLIVIKLNYISLIIGELTAIFFVSLLILYILYKKNFIDISKTKILYKQSYSFGFPLVVSAIGAFGLQMIDRIFILHIIDAKAVGLYSVAYQFGMAINMFFTSINKVWSPWVFKALKDKYNKKEIVKKSYFLALAFIISYLLFILAMHFIFPYLVDEKFLASEDLIPYIAMGYLFFAFYILVIPYVIYTGKTNKMFYITISSFILNCILNYILIPLHGVVGAAYATIASFILTFVLTAILANNVYPMPWNLFKKRINEKD
jgi:O-antigen/teichoic acid export membrane protein